MAHVQLIPEERPVLFLHRPQGMVKRGGQCRCAGVCPHRIAHRCEIARFVTRVSVHTHQDVLIPGIGDDGIHEDLPRPAGTGAFPLPPPARRGFVQNRQGQLPEAPQPVEGLPVVPTHRSLGRASAVPVVGLVDTDVHPRRRQGLAGQGAKGCREKGPFVHGRHGGEETPFHIRTPVPAWRDRSRRGSGPLPLSGAAPGSPGAGSRQPPPP